MQVKKIFLSFFFAFSLFSAYAQDQDPGPGTITVFSEKGENFTLYLNGDQKNATPSARVVISNVAEIPLSFRIVFQNSTIPEITKKGIRQGTNCIYAIEKNKKGAYVFKMKGCNNEVATAPPPIVNTPNVSSETQPAPATQVAPDQLSATYSNGIITINDGRTLTVKKVKVNGMTYPRLIFTALAGANISLSYDGSKENFAAESPMQYEVKDFQNNNAYFTLTVDEGGPKKTWHVKLQNANGYDLKIE